jgi:hypothetical protein
MHLKFKVTNQLLEFIKKFFKILVSEGVRPIFVSASQLTNLEITGLHIFFAPHDGLVKIKYCLSLKMHRILRAGGIHIQMGFF